MSFQSATEQVWDFARDLLSKKKQELKSLENDTEPKAFEVDEAEKRMKRLRDDIEELEEMIP